MFPLFDYMIKHVKRPIAFNLDNFDCDLSSERLLYGTVNASEQTTVNTFLNLNAVIR